MPAQVMQFTYVEGLKNGQTGDTSSKSFPVEELHTLDPILHLVMGLIFLMLLSILVAVLGFTCWVYRTVNDETGSTKLSASDTIIFFHHHELMDSTTEGKTNHERSRLDNRPTQLYQCANVHSSLPRSKPLTFSV